MSSSKISGLAVLVVLAAAARVATGQTGQTDPANPLGRLLAEGHAVFGLFSGDKTPSQGAAIAATRDTDFVFYSLESGPFDIPSMRAYMTAMAEAAGPSGPHPIALRIPPIREGRQAALDHARQGLEADVDALVFPHVETPAEAAFAVQAMGEPTWPLDPHGRVAMLLIEDRIGVENASAIVATPGVGIIVPGPGDLRRAYDGDPDAVEVAIQTVLAACLEHDVPCGITAGPGDIADRLAQGFRVFIVTRPEALEVGRRASGRGSP